MLGITGTRYFCLSLFHLCLCAGDKIGTFTKIHKALITQPTNEMWENVWDQTNTTVPYFSRFQGLKLRTLDQAKTTGPYHSWNDLRDKSARTKDQEQNKPMTTSSRVLTGVSATAEATAVRAGSASQTHGDPQGPKSAGIAPSMLHNHDTSLKGESDMNADDLSPLTSRHSDVWSSWINLEESSSFVDSSSEALPQLTALLSGNRGTERSLLSPSPLIYQSDTISTVSGDQKIDLNYQTETDLESSAATGEATSTPNTASRVSILTAVSLGDENVHQNNTVFELDFVLCRDAPVRKDTIADHGTVLVVLRETNEFNLRASITCSFRLLAPPGKFLVVSFDEMFHPSDLSLMAVVQDCYKASSIYGAYFTQERPPDLYSSTNCMKFYITARAYLQRQVLFRFTSNTSPLVLSLTFLTERYGFVTTPLFDKVHANYPPGLKASTMIMLHRNYSSIMISFETLVLTEEKNCITFFEATNSTSDDNVLFKVCHTDLVESHLFRTSLKIEFVSAPRFPAIGFKMRFSFHTQEDEPRISSNGRYNCTSANYELFKQHVECNLFTECKNNEDESDCSYTSVACKGAVAYGSRCYSYVIWMKSLTWNEAYQECLLRNSDLVSLNTIEETKAILKTIQAHRSSAQMYVGLKTSYPDLPKMYRRILRWNDLKTAFDFRFDVNPKYPSCGKVSLKGYSTFTMSECDKNILQQFICEFSPSTKPHVTRKQAAIHNNNSISFPETDPSLKELRLWLPAATRCPDGHVTHDFLSCDPAIGCFAKTDVDTCETENGGVIPLFTCEDGVQTLAFTLVCNHQQDCRDGSDEDRCVFEACEGFLCDNLQCIQFIEVCDGMDHCLTGRDEQLCSQAVQNSAIDIHRVITNMSIVTLDGHGDYDIASSNQMQEQVKIFQSAVSFSKDAGASSL